MLPKAIPTQAVPISRPRVPSELLPLAIAFVVISFAFGVLARESGMPLSLALLMSALVYAGTAQVVALGLLAANQPIWLVILITFLINSRFLLMGSVMAQKTASWSSWNRFLFGSQLTDETFAVLLSPQSPGLSDPRAAIGLQLSVYVAWLAGTVMGFGLGADSSQLRGFGLDFALLAMMLAVLVVQLRDLAGVAVALVAAFVAVGVHQAGYAWAAPLVAAVAAPAIGMWMEKKWTSHSSR